jgi:glycine betaine/proline transport system permease protein
VSAPGEVLAPGRSLRSGATTRRIAPPALIIGALIIVGLALGDDVPTWLDAHVRPATDRLYLWTVRNRQSFWLFSGVTSPLADAFSACDDAIRWVLRTLRWPGVLTAVAMVGWRTGGWRAALTATAALTGCGVLGLWDDTMTTLSLMAVAVVISLAIGVPLGIWSGLDDRADRWLKAVLDAAQVMPAYVYLLPIVVLFGIGSPAAIVATVVFAVAPAVRLTSLGIRSVPVVASEVGTSFGCTRAQLLRKVQLPMARRAVLLGLNQVIMMGFGVVVIAALVGTGGLGGGVLGGLQKVDVGRAFVPGLALVLAAVALDRMSTGEHPSGPPRVPALARWSAATRARPRAAAAAMVGAVAAVAVIAKAAGIDRFPSWLTVDLARPVNAAAEWANRNLRRDVPVIGGTGPISDLVVRRLLNPLRDDLLLALPWWLVIVAFVAVGWASGGARLAALVGSCLAAICALRVWDLAMDTLSQVIVAVVISIALAVPLGVWCARSDRAQALMRPVLDAMQVLPSFVYLVPVIFLFNVGRVPGVIASVIYALPPGIRLTNLGLRSVPAPVREAAVSFGATPRQELVKVQIPLALKSVMLGINQTIMMVLSMVIVAALIGAGALGLEAVYGLTKSEIGRGVAGGAAIVLLAIALDRITQAWGERADLLRPHRGR